jgi:CBS domain-containing protein
MKNHTKTFLTFLKNHIRTVLILLLLPVLLALGIVMVLFMKMMVSMETGTIIIALLVPWLGYLLLSGALEEIGFAGVKAKFALTASTGISSSVARDMTPKAHDFLQVGNEGPSAIEVMLNHYKFSEGKPIVFCFILGGKYYTQPESALFIKHLAVYRSFKLIVFLDQFNRVIAYMPYWKAQELLSDEKEGKQFISYINTDKVVELSKFPKVVTKLLTTHSTSAEALRLMNEHNLDALVIVDADQNLKGVVERDELLSRMMQTLVGKSTIGA